VSRVSEQFQDLYEFHNLDDAVHLCVVNIGRVAEIYFPGETLTRPSVDESLFTGLFSACGLRSWNEFSSFKSFKRQIEWFCGRLAFALLDESFLGGGHAVEKRATGEPYISGLNQSLSISHSGFYAAAAIAPEAVSIGIDLEKIRAFQDKQGFLRIAFPEEDSARISALSDEEILVQWTLKECFLKIIGRGFGESLREVKILNKGFAYKGRTLDAVARWTHLFDGHLVSAIWCDRKIAKECKRLFG